MVHDLSSQDILVMVSVLVGAGIFSQWLSWKIKLPSILLLLLSGIVAGPVLGWVETDRLLGQLFHPLVSISVAIILFEGGLNLKWSELIGPHRTVQNLLTIGVLISWGLTTLFANFVLGFGWPLSLLLGAILVVTGPTVVIPILRMVRPKGHVNSVLKWEGILNDPIGAILAVLVYEAILAGEFSWVGGLVFLGLLKTITISLILGGLGASVFYGLSRFRWVPTHLEIPIILALLTFAFTGSNFLQDESGLLTVTLMGIFLANQKSVDMKPILEFSEHLRVLLISGLFILLAAQLNLEDFELLSIQSVWFILLLMLVVRPTAVFLSTRQSDLTFREKVFIAWMAPRGIVAAAVASLMAFRLMNDGYPSAERFVPIVFLIIMVTITVYGLTAIPLVKLLKLNQEKPQGILFVGAHDWALALASALHDFNHQVLLVDTDPIHIEKARKAGLPAKKGSVLSDWFVDDLDLDGIGYVIAWTPSDKINSLAVLQFTEILGKHNAFQLKPDVTSSASAVSLQSSEKLTGSFVFHPAPLFSDIANAFDRKGRVDSIQIETETPLDQFWGNREEEGIGLFVKRAEDGLEILTSNSQESLQPGDILMVLMMPSGTSNTHSGIS